MTKADLAALIQKKVALKTKAEAEKALAGILEAITGALTKGDKLTLTGFGSFDVKKTAARTGRNPRTGAAIKIPARKTVKYSVGKGLKDAVN